MSVNVHNKQKVRMRKKKHIRKSLSGTPERPRLTVFRSLKHTYAQIIDDNSQKTLLSASSLSKDIKDDIAKAKTKTEVARIIGINVAQKAKSLNLNNVIFDRSGYIYHGRVKALADGAREGGLNF